MPQARRRRWEIIGGSGTRFAASSRGCLNHFRFDRSFRHQYPNTPPPPPELLDELRAELAFFAVNVPNNPCASSPGPAAKKSVLALPDAPPCPKSNPHNPWITSALPLLLLRKPTNFPFFALNAPIFPDP